MIHSTDTFRNVEERRRTDREQEWVTALLHSPAQALAAGGACFGSVHFDHGLISALLIKFSICFIVNEVRRAGTRSHSAKKEKNLQKAREELVKMQ